MLQKAIIMIQLVGKIVPSWFRSNLSHLISDFKESCIRIQKIRLHHNYKQLRKVRISVNGNSFGSTIQSQSPKQLGVVGKSVFLMTLFPDVNIVINEPNPLIPLKSKTGENWLFLIEPPGYVQKLGYNKSRLLKKFSRVYTSDESLYKLGGKFIASPPYVHWHLEISSYNKKKRIEYDYDFLKSQVYPPAKNSNLTVINSNISHLPGHQKRADFIQKLCSSNISFNLYGGSNWNVFAQYIDNAPNGKWPIFSNSRYTLVIENECAPFYWTEKITDAILCWSMPIYYGCPTICDFFPEGSYRLIDIDSEDAIAQLQNILSSSYYEDNIANLAQARMLIMEKYNILNFIDNEIEQLIK